MDESQTRDDFNCDLCTLPDTDQMVKCDKCKKWLHYNCANVNADDVEDENSHFYCQKCNKKAKQQTKEKKMKDDKKTKQLSIPSNDNNGSRLSAASVTTNRSSAPQEYNQSTIEYVPQTETIATNDTNIRQQDPSRKKSSTVKSQSVNSKSSSRTNRSTSEMIIKLIEEQRRIAEERDKEFFEQQRRAAENRDREYLEKKLEVIRVRGDSTSSLSAQGNFDDAQYESITAWTRDQEKHNEQRVSFNHDSVRPARSQQTNMRAPIQNQHHQKSSNLESLPWLSARTQTDFLSSTEVRPIPNRVVSNGEQFECSRQKIAAKYIYDLPTFSGCPSEWPLFISSYMRSTKELGLSNHDNLCRLQRSLVGEALRLVKCYLIYDESVPKAINALRLRFGRPELILDDMIKQIRCIPKVNVEKMETLIEFSIAVQHMCVTMQASGMIDHLNNPTLLTELVEKLPGTQKLEWAAVKLNCGVVNLSHFDTWLSQLAERASMVLTGSLGLHGKLEERPTRQNRNKKSTFHAVHIERTPQTFQNCCLCQDHSHDVSQCPIFKKKNIADRWNVVRDHVLCRKCLTKHDWKFCKSKVRCGVNNCQFRHHSLLHDPIKHACENKDVHTKNPSNTPDNSHLVSTHLSSPLNILFRVVPVSLSGPSKTIKTFAFLDEGSSKTLLDDDIAEALDLKGHHEPLHLRWTSNMTREEKNSRRVSLNISGDDGIIYPIENVHTVRKLELVIQSQQIDPKNTQYKHLRNLPIRQFEKAKPTILIGMEHWKLSLPMEVREGDWGEPGATRTRLGWVLHGAYREDKVSEIHNFHCHISEPESDETLHDAVREFFSIESFGVKVPENFIESRDDARARLVLERTIRQVEGRYEVGLLWCHDEIKLPDARDMAMKRFLLLEKRMQNDTDLYHIIKQQIQDYTNKGYARKLTDVEVTKRSNKTWYLPIFPVRNANKPGKLRLVWDAAATVNGVSLNTKLLKGPDMLCKLPEILYRFRQERVAISGDIKEMYHQIRIIEEDRDSQRFLWRDSPNNNIEVFILNVMTFGASCSPSAAHFVKNTHAQQFEQESPRAVVAIRENHYVDDWLDSFGSEEEACSVVNDVRRIHSLGGFTIRNWASNSAVLLRKLGCDETNANEINLNVCHDYGGTKVLGMWWNVEKDIFHYVLNFNRVNPEILSGVRRPTKREVLRTLMLIYDPLGLIASFLVFVKILLQDIWRSKVEWDQQVNNEQHRKWLRWISMIPKVQDIEVPRCYFSRKYDRMEMHVFVDASDAAFAAVAYYRYICANEITCSLISAKTKVAPLLPMSIPRLELQAAVLGARLFNSIEKGHSKKCESVTIWTDSADVLYWLRSDHKKYRQFVAYRVGEILETTKLSNWRWVPSKCNVADEATKWKEYPKLSSRSRWYVGPEFLYGSENDWPVERQTNSSADEELKPVLIHISKRHNIFLSLLENSSCWRKTYRKVAWILRFIDVMKNQRHGNGRILSSYEIKRAKSKLYREAQLEVYGCEIALLEKCPNSTVDKTSLLYQYVPFLDEHGVLRMKGRTGRAEFLKFDTINPVILPRHSKLTHLILSYFHEKYLHMHRETVVNEVRLLYNISHLRATLQKVISNCQLCKNRNVKSNPPLMADHPKARVAAFSRPFSYVGIDFFGPFEVVVGRRAEKRYGCLFTCLTIRAIHIEVAHSLNKDSFMMCLRNFIARRGMPLEIRTDNGTNFIGVRNELRKLTQQIPFDEIAISFDEINWILNPPLAPHMGGCWEREVQSIKKCLNMKLNTKRPDDENLRCYLMEVESIINSRPLTYIPVGPEEPQAMTPNHFLLGSSNGMKPFSESGDEVNSMRRTYKLSQHMSLLFWKRWIKEYMPTLTRRTKWYKRTEPLKVGDVVVIMDESKRNSWLKGIVIEAIGNKRDDQVRQVVVKTSSGVYTRPATKVGVLDIDDSSGKQSLPHNVSANTYQGGEC